MLRAPACNGVYIVAKVTKGLDELALIAAMAGEIRDIDDTAEDDLSSTNIQYEPTDLILHLKHQTQLS